MKYSPVFSKALLAIFFPVVMFGCNQDEASIGKEAKQPTQVKNIWRKLSFDVKKNAEIE